MTNNADCFEAANSAHMGEGDIKDQVKQMLLLWLSKSFEPVGLQLWYKSISIS